jgi:hypothetical protein
MAERHQSPEWFVKDDSGVRGPISEAQLRAIVKQSSNPRLQVKQGNSEWHPAAVIRKKMDQLVASGIYIQCAGIAEGPFTISKANQLLQTVSIDGVEVRTGESGKWVSATAWLKAVRKLERKRQAKQNEEPIAPVNRGPTPVTPIQMAIIVNDDPIVMEAIVVEEDILEAVLVDPVPQTPVHAVPQPAQPYAATPVHVPRMPARAPARPRSQARSSRTKGGAGPVLVKIGSLAISILVIVGFLGSFTTFSTFSMDTIHWIETGAVIKALAYILASVTACVLGAWAGLASAKQLFLR